MTVNGEEELWEHTLELCRGLSAAGVEVVLAVLGPRPDQRRLTAALCIDKVEVALAPALREGFAIGGDPRGEWLLDLELGHQCELVHLNGYENAGLAFRSPKVVLAASCGLSWWKAVQRSPLPPAAETYRRKVTAALASADCVVAPSAALLEAVDNYYGPLPASTVIFPGRSSGAFAAGDKEPFVLGVGALSDEARNSALLARVASALPWPVKIAGAAEDGPAPDGDPLGALLVRLRDADDMARLYGQAAVFASTARFEALGLTVHEAALSECALVLPDLPCLREIWTGAAAFVAPDDGEALRTSLCTLMNQPELTAMLALRARQRALCHSATRMVKRYLAVYRRLMATRPTPAYARELRLSLVS
jgi:glycosyltransferase involved in cell wall biosynthesis